MKNSKKILAMLMSISILASLSACNNDESLGSDTDGSDESTTTQATTTAKTVALNTETLAAEDQATVSDATSALRDVELENKEIKWIGTWDLNPTETSGGSKSLELELFEEKYGGYVTYYPTTWDTRYNDLSTFILGGEGVDFFNGAETPFPSGIITGMFQPVDDYIDINDPLWAGTKKIMENFNFGGNHYKIITNVAADNLIYYNKATMDIHGFDDPWELYEAGEWNTDKFTEMLTDFVDTEADQWGLDGWWITQGLSSVPGKYLVGLEDGHLVCNIDDPAIEANMNFQYELFKNGLVMPLDQFDWAIQPQFMGEGKELFFIAGGGSYFIQKAPELWDLQMNPEDLGVVPMPCDAEGNQGYLAQTNGYLICKDAANPIGVGLFSDCTMLASTDEEVIEVGRKKRMEDFGMSEEILDRLDVINKLALEYPATDFSSGASSDVLSVVNTISGGAIKGTDWATSKDQGKEVLAMLIDEVDAELQTALAELG